VLRTDAHQYSNRSINSIEDPSVQPSPFHLSFPDSVLAPEYDNEASHSAISTTSGLPTPSSDGSHEFLPWSSTRDSPNNPATPGQLFSPLFVPLGNDLNTSQPSETEHIGALSGQLALPAQPTDRTSESSASVTPAIDHSTELRCSLCFQTFAESSNLRYALE